MIALYDKVLGGPVFLDHGVYVCVGFYVGQDVEYGGTLTEMLKPRGQTGLEAKILASAS